MVDEVVLVMTQIQNEKNSPSTDREPDTDEEEAFNDCNYELYVDEEEYFDVYEHFGIGSDISEGDASNILEAVMGSS
jgi:hypothetical protein